MRYDYNENGCKVGAKKIEAIVTVGCDGISNSGKVTDDCNVCDGDGSTSPLGYEYTFGDWKDNGCGNEMTRTESESCAAASGCMCSNKRDVKTKTRAGPCCAVDYAYTFGDWSDDGCSKEQSRVEVESCSAASNCTCSNKRNVKTETRAGPCCGEGDPADLRLSGDTCGGEFNGAWTYEGTTADGKYYYSHDTQSSFGVDYLFFDKDSDGSNTGCDWLKNRWFIDTKSSTTAVHDLDGDGGCMNTAYTANAASTTSLTPPTSAEWTFSCSDGWTLMTFTLTPICDSTPDYVYTYPSAWTNVNTGCGTDVARRRTSVESCSARTGCSCRSGSKRNVQTETEDQEPCTTTPTTSITTSTILRVVCDSKNCYECDWNGVDTDGKSGDVYNYKVPVVEAETKCKESCLSRSDCNFVAFHNNNNGNRYCHRFKTCNGRLANSNSYWKVWEKIQSSGSSTATTTTSTVTATATTTSSTSSSATSTVH